MMKHYQSSIYFSDYMKHIWSTHQHYTDIRQIQSIDHPEVGTLIVTSERPDHQMTDIDTV